MSEHCEGMENTVDPGQTAPLTGLIYVYIGCSGQFVHIHVFKVIKYYKMFIVY